MTSMPISGKTIQLMFKCVLMDYLCYYIMDQIFSIDS